MAGHPISLVVTDDLRRSRLTVFFRLVLAIPHVIWVWIWSLAAFTAAFIAWLIALVTGRVPGGLHEFIALYTRYLTHLFAYLTLAANPYPGFVGEEGSYPIDVKIGPAVAQSRWKTLFRPFLAIPALLLLLPFVGRGPLSWWPFGPVPYYDGIQGTAAFLGWFASLATGKMPAGFRNGSSYTLRYTAQSYGYLFMLTDVYPDSTPATDLPGSPPSRVVGLAVDDDLRRSRLTVFFRLLLALPHFIWLVLWNIVAMLAMIVNWIATLVAGRSPQSLHRFLSAFVRYQSQLWAFVFLIANPFPGFTGAPGTYPVEATSWEAEDQSRWITLGRLILVFPAALMSAPLSFALMTVGILGWFASLVLGRMPSGMRDLGAYALRYQAQVNAYYYVLTDEYPYSGPELGTPSPAELEGTSEAPEPLLA